jgi:hypothetical protein
MNGSVWNAEKIASVIRRDERIRRADLILRKERGLL